MRTTLYLTVALLSIALLIQSHYARKSSDLTRRAWAQTDRAIKVAEDWRTAFHAMEKVATNCVAKLRGQ